MDNREKLARAAKWMERYLEDREAWSIHDQTWATMGRDELRRDLDAMRSLLAAGPVERFAEPEQSPNVGTQVPPLGSNVGTPSIKIGSFILYPYKSGRYGLYKDSGEGGEFDASKLEKHLGEFYDREF